jgi:putative acetyltransferase
MAESLCESCARVREILTPRGSRFLLCRLSATDPAYPKYPRQPVVRCSGYWPKEGPAAAGAVAGEAPTLPWCPVDELTVRPLGPASDEAGALVAELDAHQMSLYPPESTHLLAISELAAPGAVFLGAYPGGRLVGCCGSVTRPGGYVELKRLFVRPAARNRGVAGALLAELEARARAAGARLLRAETGVRQPDSVRVCERAGFVRCGPFGDYPDDPLSVFLEKRLDDPPEAPGAQGL